jgi:hypothetical protein
MLTTKKTDDEQDETSATVSQLATAMAALGKYAGANTDAEHAAEAVRLGSERFYRSMLANALLGIVETEAILSDAAGGLSGDQLLSAHRQALVAAGVGDDGAKLLQFLRNRTLRVEGPLRQLAQDTTTGPLVLAAAHAGAALQRLLAVCAADQDPVRADPYVLSKDLDAAREALTNAVTNIDIMLRLVQHAEILFPRKRP